MAIGLRLIRYFMAVAEELHFGRAAERLGIAQPALSRAIRNLEIDLGVQLFERSNRRVAVTPAGRAFFDGCQGIVNALDHTIETTRQVQQGRIGVLRIGYTDFAIAGMLPRLLREFRMRYPGIILQPHHDVTTDQLIKLEAGTLDVGVVTGPLRKRGYNQHAIHSDHFVCVVYENHPLANRSSIELSELAQEDFVHGPTRDWEHFFSYFIPICRKAGFVPRIVQEAFNSAGILGLVASGMGITVLTESTQSFAAQGLVSIPLIGVSERLATVAIWKDQTSDGPIKLFGEFIQNFEPSGDPVV